MGIRYYAYPVAPELTSLAATSPRDFISSDPLADAWGPTNERPEMLYLDKCWRELQLVFEPDGDGDARPAYDLVDGEVTMTQSGWIPVVRYLTPDRVRQIADDLNVIDECEVMERLSGHRSHLMWDFEAEVRYTLDYMDDAAVFTQQLAKRGFGLAYMIG